MRFAGKQYHEKHRELFKLLGDTELSAREDPMVVNKITEALATRFHLDPRIVAALEQSPWPLQLSTLQTVLNEWPHISESKDRARVAYLRYPEHL